MQPVVLFCFLLSGISGLTLEVVWTRMLEHVFGATLPLLSRYIISREAHMNRVGSRIGGLYTVNTTGAIGGVFLTTFALLPVVGLSATNKIAGTINICLCIAIIAGRKWHIQPSDLESDKDDLDTMLDAQL